MDNTIIDKTQFILDCSSVFRNTPCGQTYEVDAPNRMRINTGFQPIPPISKSLYTCTIEGVLEYSRIVWDLFPNGEKGLKFIGAAPEIIKDINKFDPNEQNYERLFQSFIDFSIFLKNMKVKNTKDNTKEYICEALSIVLKNAPQKPSRFIIITHFENVKAINKFQQQLQKIMFAYSNDRHVYMSRHELPLVDIVVINTLPVSFLNEFELNTPTVLPLFEKITLTFYSIHSGANVYGKLIYLAFDHYHLTSTTVSGIPMKEEQHAGLSIEYDVEIVHSKKTHDQFFSNSFYDIDEQKLFKKASLEGQDYPTLMLKWCTPKVNSPEVHTCIGAYRFTAVKLTSRPSSCLINFLHTGKMVSLEISKITKSAKSTRIVSHQLQSHNGELFIHVLSPSKSLLEDTPAISEGVGGHITDYRTQAFADFMKRHRLVKTDTIDPFMEHSKAILSKKTIYFPITFSQSVFFNLNDNVTNLYNLITYKLELSNEELIQIKQIFYQILQTQSDGHSLPLHTNILRSKGLKKDDLFMILWNEIECLLKCNSSNSPGNEDLLDCLLQLRPKNDRPIDFGSANSLTLLNKKNGQSMNKASLQSDLRIEYPLITLQDIFQRQLNKTRKRRDEFHGRLDGSKITKLYADMNNEDRS